MSDPDSSTVIVYTTDPSKEVSIAGNFTNWSPEQLSWNPSSKRYEFEVVPTGKAGKLSFKFIVDGDWIVDQNFASEFDEMGNENNVILYDCTTEKVEQKETYETSTKSALQKENQAGPGTPDATPTAGFSSPSSAPLTTTASLSEPEAKTEAKPEESTVASKTVPKTLAPVEPSFIGSPGVPPALSSTKQENPPEPQPVSRPTAPEQTQSKAPIITPVASGSSSSGPSPSNPQSVHDDSIPGSFHAQERRETPSSSGRVVSSRGDDGIPKDWNFFANLLHLIAQFFRSWFRRGGM